MFYLSEIERLFNFGLIIRFNGSDWAVDDFFHISRRQWLIICTVHGNNAESVRLNQMSAVLYVVVFFHIGHLQTKWAFRRLIVFFTFSLLLFRQL